MEKYLWIWLAVINAAAFLLYAADKRRAKKKKWRVRESVLLGLAALGGAAGALAAMQLFRHKTQKKPFSVGVPLMLILQLGLLGWWLSVR